MQIEVKEIEKPAFELSLDGKKVKLTAKEAEELYEKLRAVLSKPPVWAAPQVVYIDRWHYIQSLPPSLPPPAYPTWQPIITCGPSSGNVCTQMIGNVS